MKQGLSKTVVDDGGNQSRQFSAEELRGLFKVKLSALGRLMIGKRYRDNEHGPCVEMA
jgi:hypothetical protein